MWNFAIANCELPESFVYAVTDVVMSDNARMVGIHSLGSETLPENWDKKHLHDVAPRCRALVHRECRRDDPADMIHGG